MSTNCRMCRGPFVRRVGRRNGRAFVECVDCGFIFPPPASWGASPVPASGNVSADLGDGAVTETTFLEPAFERFGRGRPLYLLAFGGSQSGLPAQLRRIGHRVIAVDRTAPRRPHRDSLTGDLLEMNLVPGQFDLAYADRALERLPEPRPVLEELLRLTRTGGLVAIHTELDGAFRQPVSPECRSYFRQRTFEKALEERNDTLVEVHPHLVLIEVRERAAARRPPRRHLLHDEALERR